VSRSSTSKTKASPKFKLYVITDRRLAAARGGLVSTCAVVLRAAREAGFAHHVAIQLREKDLPAREMLGLALELRRVCAELDGLLLVNDRLDVALAAGADGVHLPADSFSVPQARALIGAHRLIGVSTHRVEEAVAAAKAGADFAVFGPVFTPLSKGAYAPPAGVKTLRAACRAATIPIYALGGITRSRVAALAGSGAAGVGVIGAIMGAPIPEEAAVEILRELAH
jgi:thiamine-phosphate pyrophosphorylase